MKDKLQQFALIAEIISAIAIVLSLIFVGLQVQQGAEATDTNSEAIRGQVRQAMLETDMNIIIYAGNNNLMGGEVTSENWQKVRARDLMHFRSRENYWMQHRMGLLDDETYIVYRNNLINDIIFNAWTADQWRRVTGTDGAFNAGFVSEINASLAEQGFDVERIPLMDRALLRMPADTFTGQEQAIQ